MHMYIESYAHQNIRVRAHMCVYVCVRVRVCVRVCVCVHSESFVV